MLDKVSGLYCQPPKLNVYLHGAQLFCWQSSGPLDIILRAFVALILAAPTLLGFGTLAMKRQLPLGLDFWLAA